MRNPVSSAALTFSMVSAALILLGGFRIAFNMLALSRDLANILADVIFLFSYINIITIVGSSGISAISQRLIGTKIAQEAHTDARDHFYKGMFFCLLVPIVIDLLVRIICITLGWQTIPWISLPLTGLIGLYNYVKPLCFTYKRQRAYSCVESGAVLLAFGWILLFPSPSVIANTFVLCAPQVVVAVFGAIQLSITNGPFISTDLAFDRTQRNDILWGTLGVTSSMGLVYLLNLIGRGALEDETYAIYGTLIQILAALNLFNRSLALILFPKFTNEQGKSGKDAASALLRKAIRGISLTAIPLWFLLGLSPAILVMIFSMTLPTETIPTAIILILHAFVCLILGPLVQFNLGAGKFRVPHIGSALGALLALAFVSIGLPNGLGMPALAGALLLSSSTNYLWNARHLIREHCLDKLTLGLAFGGQLATLAAYSLITLLS